VPAPGGVHFWVLSRRSLLSLALATPLAVAPLLAAAWQACAIYDTSLLLPPPPDAADEAAPEAATTPDADTCAHARWPSPPAADDPTTGSPATVIDALRTLDIGSRNDGGAPPVYGFDLDGVCTCPAPDSCRTPSGSAPRCDEEGGRDNAGGELLRTFGSFNVFNQDDLTRRLQAGLYGLLMMVRDYNGAANDTRVTVAVYISNGVNAVADGGTFPPPAYDGTDHWTVDPGSLLGGASLDGADCAKGGNTCVPIYFDDKAYVSNHVLVASLDFPLSLGGGANMGFIALDLTGSVVTARLVPRGTTFALEDGRITGRWATSKLLASLAVLPDPFVSGGYLCGDDPTYLSVKKKICDATDIATSAGQDGKGAACDALSVGFGFTAEPALLGRVLAPRGATPHGCSDGGAPVQDQCPSP
jgi:hypothetical protein